MADLLYSDHLTCEPPSHDFIVGLHHLGYLTADLPAAAVHFTRVLGYRLESPVIEDLVQTACVQFLRLPGATSWLELVAPNGPNSRLSNALKRGNALHHICYEVTDMERACACYRELGCLPVGLPTLASAFPGRRIAWFMDNRKFLFELVESGAPPLTLKTILAPSL